MALIDANVLLSNLEFKGMLTKELKIEVLKMPESKQERLSWNEQDAWMSPAEILPKDKQEVMVTRRSDRKVVMMKFFEDERNIKAFKQFAIAWRHKPVAYQGGYECTKIHSECINCEENCKYKKETV